MNGIDKITERIKADIQKEIDDIQARSREECREIAAKYDALEKEEYWKIVNKSAKEAALRVERLSNMAMMESKKQLLALKQEMVEETFDLAVTKIAELPEGEYLELLAGFARRASATGGEELILSPADRPRFGEKVRDRANQLLAESGKPGKLTLSARTRPMRGGLILTDGKVDVNYSLEALASAHKNSLTEQVSKILFQ